MRALPLLCLTLLAGCYPIGPELVGDGGACDESFNDHTAPLDSAEALGGASESLLLITSLMSTEARTVRVLEADFYELHDEWSWFRLLNNQTACGATTDPVDVGRTFDSIDDIYAWARDEDELPLDLEFTSDGRLYSPSFYTLSLRTDPRIYAPGNLFLFEDEDGRAAYAWELTFVDEPRRPEVEAMLQALSTPLGPDVYWRTVSPAQEDLGRSIAASDSPFADRILVRGARPPRTVCACVIGGSAAPSGWLALLLFVFVSCRSRLKPQVSALIAT